MRQDRNLYIPVAILIGLIGEFPTHGLANGQRADEPSPPLAISIQKNQKSLAISGIASSAAHEVKLRQTALQYFGDLKITVNLSGGARTPRGWALVTEMVLRALEHTDAARASISASIISIQGVTTHKDEYDLALQRVESALPEGMSMDSHVFGMSSDRSFVELCQERFRTAAESRTIEFAVSTTDFNENALPLLDALIEIAIDCPATIIRVTGHTDDSGNIASNAILGRARAMRMIAYMASRGVPIDQFEAPVSVSDQANTDGPTVRSRQLSRRAEIEMIIP